MRNEQLHLLLPQGEPLTLTTQSKTSIAEKLLDLILSRFQATQN